LFTPAGYTFGIWALIYMGPLYYGIYMIYCSFSAKKSDEFIPKSAPWIILAHLANGAWLWFWLHKESAISVILIFLILLFLLIAVIRLNMERWDADVDYMAGVWWPIDLYVGWITVAAIANVAAHLNHINVDMGLTEISWTIIFILIAVAINLFMVFTRNMREFAGVGIWALIGISVRHWNEIPEISWTAILGAVTLFIIIAVHAYKNRATLPHNKLKQKT
ncbi:MAG: tryptophan-rich sensory protein, partial [Crocinitomicaceae bacterium]|nr:tryptophan-rich sensory protein [Crocinitomicaceae bacterium]